jgi:hypothetical protein
MKRSVKMGTAILAIVIAIGFFFGTFQSRHAKILAPLEYKDQGLDKQMTNDLGYVAATTPESPARKIIQNGYVSMLVKHYDPFYQALQRQLAQEGGFISNLEANRNGGSLISARITVRVPSSRTNVMVSWLHEKGDIITEKITAEDVSEEYYDTEARLTNAKRLEVRLMEMVKTNTGKLEDLILLEEKIGEIRGQIEQMEARIRTLNRLVSLATLTIDVQVSTTAPVIQPPTFASRIGKTWRESTEALTDFLKGTALIFVGALPWLPVLFLLIAALVFIYKIAARIFRKHGAESSV